MSETLFSHCRLASALGGGADGLRYEGTGPDGAEVEAWLLKVPPAERKPLERRLKTLALCHHPAILRVRQLELDQSPGLVLVEAGCTITLAEDPPWTPAINPHTAAALALRLALGLADAHRLGAGAGGFDLRAIVRPAGGAPVSLAASDIRELEIGRAQTLELWRLDLSGLDVRPASPAADSAVAWPPEVSDPTAPADPAGDIYSLAAILVWLITGKGAQPHGGNFFARTLLGEALPETETIGPAESVLARLIERMLARDPADRPTAAEVVAELKQFVRDQTATLGDAGSNSVSLSLSAFQSLGGAEIDPLVSGSQVGLAGASLPSEPAPGGKLGRYQLVEKLGEGGMGMVFRAVDPVDGREVAIKLLRTPGVAGEPPKRFLKEARLLAEVHNPFVANLLEVNSDAGVHYIVLEYIRGESLGSLLTRRRRISERESLAIIADVCRALADAHAAGIVHRDIKPDNIMLETAAAPDAPPHVKLTDFGIARHVVESESLAVTQAGSILGTPLYMSPEQCLGDGNVGPTSDVYSLGATLFQLLAGRPPFQANTALAILGMHTSEPPPALDKLNAEISQATCRIVERCLAKRPGERYADAAALVEDLDRVLRGEPTGAAVHPQLPPHEQRNVVQYDFEWDLESPPEQLWPYVSNTERLNRAIGLPAAEFTNQADDDGHVQRFAQFRAAGFDNRWQEHPYEWIEGRKLGVLREFTAGPFKWFVSAVELLPRAGGGTRLVHRIRVEPHGIFGRTVAAVKLGSQGKRSLGKVYQRIDAALRGRLGPVADPFEEPAPLPAARRQRLDKLLDRLGQLGVEPRTVERLGDFVATAAPQDCARIRPLVLASRMGLPAEEVTKACLLGAREGMFVLLWDLICPLCRIPSEVQPSLATLREHGECPACQTEFPLDFASSVEMIFRVHPDLRESELGTFCIGGPGHSPHVVAQVRVAPGERLELDFSLGEGSYRLRGPNLAFSLELRVQAGALAERLDVALTRAEDWSAPRTLRPGRQRITLTNDAPRELVVRLERTASRTDALTAARASTSALFRELFPGEVLAAGQLVSVSTLTFLVLELDSPPNLYADLGDARAFAIVHAMFGIINRLIREEQGALVKTVGEGVLAVFRESDAAVRAALAMPGALAANEKTQSLRLRGAIHRGPAMAATLNDTLDYFGGIVREAAEMVTLAQGGKLAVSAAAAADAAAALGEKRPDSLLRDGSGVVHLYAW